MTCLITQSWMYPGKAFYMYGVFNPVSDRYLITNTLSVCLMYRPESNGRIAAIETHQVLMLPYLFYYLFVNFLQE